GRKQVVRCKHQNACFDLRFGRKRNVNSHLVAVKIGIERRTDERMDLDRLTFDKHRFKRLNTEAVKRRRPVQKNRMFANYVFQNVPNDRFLAFDHFARLFDRCGVRVLFKLVVDERLEKFERHFLRQSALMKFQFRADNDDRTSRIIDAFAEQVLTETSLFAFERAGKRFQRTVVRTAQNAAASAVVEKRIDRFLKHTFFVADDNLRSTQFHQLFQTVVAVDHATVKIVQIRRRKAAAVQRNQRAKLRRNDRNYVQDHPFGFVTRTREGR